MLLCDVNVLVFAHKSGAPRHREVRARVEALVSGESAYAVSDLVLNGFVRIVTMSRLWDRPSSLDQALRFATAVRDGPAAVRVEPGARHWGIFADLCRRAEAKGHRVPDAYLAALAIEHACEWIATDRDYARFPHLRWRHPLDGEVDPARPTRSVGGSG